MSVYHGRQETTPYAVHRGGGKYANKGVQKLYRAVKRAEAEARNRLTEHDRTRAHRLGRCGRKCSA